MRAGVADSEPCSRSDFGFSAKNHHSRFLVWFRKQGLEALQAQQLRIVAQWLSSLRLFVLLALNWVRGALLEVDTDQQKEFPINPRLAPLPDEARTE